MVELITVDPEQLIGVNDAAKILQVSRRAVTKKITHGRLPAIKIGTQWILQKRACYFHLKAMEYKKKAKDIKRV